MGGWVSGQLGTGREQLLLAETVLYQSGLFFVLWRGGLCLARQEQSLVNDATFLVCQLCRQASDAKSR